MGPALLAVLRLPVSRPFSSTPGQCSAHVAGSPYPEGSAKASLTDSSWFRIHHEKQVQLGITPKLQHTAYFLGKLGHDT